LLQGQDVYDAYKDIAPNPKKVLNVVVSTEDYIPAAELQAKLARIESGKTLAIAYAGRMIEIKGPLDWLKAIRNRAKLGALAEAAAVSGKELERNAAIQLRIDLIKSYLTP
jgi:hypothetical protein